MSYGARRQRARRVTAIRDFRYVHYIAQENLLELAASADRL